MTLKAKKSSIGSKLLSSLFIVTGAAGFTLVFFFVLPFIQAISEMPMADMNVFEADTVDLPPPPTVEEPAPEEEPEPEEEPPELIEDNQQLLTLDQLDIALGGGLSDGWMAGDFAVKIDSIQKTKKEMDELFNLADLDQDPRVIYQPNPVMNAKARQKTPGTVYVIFIVNKKGRVEKPKVQSSSDPVFDKLALKAVKQWKFEPGKRKGQPVRTRMRVPVVFPDG